MKKMLLLTVTSVIVRLLVSAQGIPYPLSSLIKEIKIDWSTHQRHASGSDNFALTWAEDNHLYGPWGDGGGFGGTNEVHRVSMGIARIEGPSENYKGYDRSGDPRSAESAAALKGKSWGILCVEGVLYMWVHPDNAEAGWGTWKDHLIEARLYRSNDKGSTWQPASWNFTTEENITGGNILQFGKNYGGSLDAYTYHYFAHPSAKLNSAGIVTELQVPGKIYLARVHKTKLMEKTAYEFFVGTVQGKPEWTRDITRKMPVFTDSNGIGSPMAICYNNGLKRYLLTTEHNQGEQGNLGLFESSTPWGPWATIAYMSASDHKEFGSDFAATVPPNTFYWAFPTKWMSNDGHDIMMTFTGAGQGKNNDSFNTVRVRLVPKDK